MPQTFRLFCIRHTTTIILVDSNLNMIQGDFRHMDQSTTITNRDAFNIETEQHLPPTTSLVVGNDGKAVQVIALEASIALIYNGCIQLQRQPPWYLQIPLPRVMNMMQIELQVGDNFRRASKICNYLQRVCKRCHLIFQTLEDHDQ